MLLAPLAREAGGLANVPAPRLPSVFANPAQTRLSAAAGRPPAKAAGWMGGSKRFDMPGFRPNEHYVREMQRLRRPSRRP